jgi:hypothetical protein
MASRAIDWNFGLAWIAFALAIGLHVADEARHNFLATYNPNAMAIRRRLHAPFPLVFTFRAWLGGLMAAIGILLLLSPLALRGAHWIRMAAVPLALLAGIANGLGHVGSSVYCRRWMAGVLSSPVLLAAGTWLLWSA